MTSASPNNFEGSFCSFCSFYRELPNWIELRVKREKRDKVDFSSDHRNGKETAILKSKIGTHNIPSHEILSDASQFRSIGLLQESMVREHTISLIPNCSVRSTYCVLHAICLHFRNGSLRG